MPYGKKYYDLEHEAGYVGVRNLLRVNVKKEKKKIYAWLSNQDAYTLRHPIKRRFPRLSYNVTNIDDVWECDLLQLTSIKDYNDGYCYILVVIDVLGKFALVEPLVDKIARNVASAFERITDRAKPRVPLCVQTDRGKEFLGAAFQNLLKRLEIGFRVARNPDIKAAVVERLNRTLRERIWRYFSHRNTKRYIDVLQKIVYAYNQSLHSGTRMRPAEVNLYNAARARENLDKRARSNYRSRHRARPRRKFDVGDHVRVSRTKNTFERGYEKMSTRRFSRYMRITASRPVHICIGGLER